MYIFVCYYFGDDKLHSSWAEIWTTMEDQLVLMNRVDQGYFHLHQRVKQDQEVSFHLNYLQSHIQQKNIRIIRKY